jgi:hypothetical protein
LPTNPHIIPSFPSDPGAAQRIVDTTKSVQNVAKQYGVLGAGVRITGGMIETADTGIRVFMRGDAYSDEGPAGLFLADADGVIQGRFDVDSGLVLLGGTGEFNELNWVSIGGDSMAGMGVFEYGGDNLVEISSFTPEPAIGPVITLRAAVDPDTQAVYATAGESSNATLITGAGDGAVPGYYYATDFIRYAGAEAEKTDVIDIDPNVMAPKIAKLKPKSYKNPKKQVQYGLECDEVAKVFPEMVYTSPPNPPDPKHPNAPIPPPATGYTTSSLVTLLLVELQRNVARIDDLEKRIIALEKK